MCKCTPGIRTPFCGKLGCEWPNMQEQNNSIPVYLKNIIKRIDCLIHEENCNEIKGLQMARDIIRQETRL